MDRWLTNRRVTHSFENWKENLSLNIDLGPVEAHLEDTQGSDILLGSFPSRKIEHVYGGNDNLNVAAGLSTPESQPSAQSVEPHTFRDAQARPSSEVDPSRP